MNGQIPVDYSYWNNSYSPSTPLVYGYEEVEGLIQKAHKREVNYYGQTDLFLYAALDQFLSHICGKRVAIMGSNVPWYEAIVIAYGGTAVTIEYNKIISKHPGIETMTVAEFAKKPETFDAVLSISSYEHDGLGRYGDPIDPQGDLKAMERTKAMLKPGGLLFLAIPVGKERIIWNANRVYGPKRLPMLFAGWKTIATFGFEAEVNFARQDPEQPVFVLALE
ncbi:MAG: DUF268 domain-containing protein [Verrucomicrobiota bacterium]|nr:DUF268 domain-containing protein [Verrucomicrobiota bacterium]